MPADMGQRIAVDQQQRRAVARDGGVDLGTAGLDSPIGEALHQRSMACSPGAASKAPAAGRVWEAMLFLTCKCCRTFFLELQTVNNFQLTFPEASTITQQRPPESDSVALAADAGQSRGMHHDRQSRQRSPPGPADGRCDRHRPGAVARVVSDGRLADAARIVVFGDRRVLEMGARDAGVELSIRPVETAERIDWDSPGVPLIGSRQHRPGGVSTRRGLGRLRPADGRHVGCRGAAGPERRAGRHHLRPLNKAALHAGGWRFPDEHKLFAHLLGHQGYFSEMNVLDGQWMSRVTSHVPLRTAVEQINRRASSRRSSWSTRTMRRAGIARPRIAVAALNPHAGENGLFGRDEIDVIAPAVRAAAASGHRLQEPLPVRHGLHQGLRRRLRQRGRDVSRPGSRSRQNCAASAAA